MKIDNLILEILELLQRKGKSVVIGGYWRDVYLNRKFNDIDILTMCNLEDLKSMFPNLNWTGKGIELGICRTNYKGVKLEFTIINDEKEFDEKIRDRDFTINTFYFDGKKMRGNHFAESDIKTRILRPVEPFQKHLEFAPQTILRAFRFVGELNFEMDNRLEEYLIKNHSLLKEIPKTRMIQDMYNIIKTPFVLKSLDYMEKLGYIDKNEEIEMVREREIPLLNESLVARLSYIDYLIGESSVKELIKTFELSLDLWENVRKYRSIYEKEYLENKRNFPFILLLKRYEYNDDKEKLLRFIKNNR